MKIYKTLIYAALFTIISFTAIYFYMFSDSTKQTYNNFEKKRILLIPSVYQNPYWQIIKKGAEDAALNRNCIIEYTGPQTESMTDSIRIFDMGIASGIDGIITYIEQEKGYDAIIKKATARGIPVITLDADAKNSTRDAYVGTNNLEAGNEAGKQLTQITLGKSKIGIIMAGKTITSQVERVKGFSNYIGEFSGMKIVATESSDSDVLEAELVAKKMLQQYPEINSIYCTSSVDGIGAARAVIENNKVSKVSIVCFDDLPETLDYIKQGVIEASIVQKPYQMGYDSVNLIIDKLEGLKVKGEYLMGTLVVNKDNVNNYNTEKGEIN